VGTTFQTDIGKSLRGDKTTYPVFSFLRVTPVDSVARYWGKLPLFYLVDEVLVVVQPAWREVVRVEAGRDEEKAESIG
jgi:hypothetical protein